MKHQRIIGKGAVLMMIACLSACYQTQDGCLDILSSNYEVGADYECEDCCEYPSLVLRLLQVNGEESFSLGDTIVNNLNIETRVLKIVYLLSGVAITLDGEAAYVNEPIRVQSDQDTIWVRDDFVRVSRIKARYEVGELRERGAISALHFQLGVPAEVDGGLFIDDDKNDLSTDPDSLRLDDRTYVVQRLYLGVGPELKDSIIVDVPASLGLEAVSIPMDTSFAAGKDKELELTVDYAGWFDDIDFVNEEQLEIAKKLKRNLAEGFRE